MAVANFEDAIIEGGYIYFYDNLLQALCRADLKEYNLEILAEYNDFEGVEINRIYSVGNCFFLVDIYSVFILQFDRNRKCYTRYQYRSEDGHEKRRYSSFLWKNEICFLPVDSKIAVVCFDIVLRKFFTTDSISQLLRSKKDMPCSAPVLYNDAVYFAVHGVNQYIMYSLSEKQAHLVELKSTKEKYIADTLRERKCSKLCVLNFD